MSEILAMTFQTYRYCVCENRRRHRITVVSKITFAYRSTVPYSMALNAKNSKVIFPRSFISNCTVNYER